MPALVVAGPGIGRIKYIQNPFARGNGSANPARSAKAEPVEGPSVSSVEDRKAAYDKRRRQVVIDAVREQLAMLGEETAWQMAVRLQGGDALAGHGLASKTLRLLSALLSQSGWRREIAMESITWPSMEEWQALSKLRNHDLGQDEQRSEMLNFCWTLLRLALRVCATRLTVMAGVRDNGMHYTEAEMFSALLGFDLAALRALAAEKIPYANAWREEVNDDWAAVPEPNAAE